MRLAIRPPAAATSGSHQRGRTELSTAQRKVGETGRRHRHRGAQAEREAEALAWLEEEHRAADRMAQKLVQGYARGLNCRRGCHSCCADGLRVHALEAALIEARHGASLRAARAQPHVPGRCAFLGAQGECRVYAHRPYMCRTQGLVLRWPAEHGQPEQRAGCELNTPLTGDVSQLPASACWTVGPFEDRLAARQWRLDPSMPRVALRDLFHRIVGCTAQETEKPQ